MGLIGRLRDLFGGGGEQPQDTGVYLYVRLNRTGEIVRLRLSPEHEFVPADDGEGYVTRKTIVGPRHFERAEATFSFDSSRVLTNADISGGALVDEAAWDAWREQESAARQQPKGDE